VPEASSHVQKSRSGATNSGKSHSKTVTGHSFSISDEAAVYANKLNPDLPLNDEKVDAALSPEGLVAEPPGAACHAVILLSPTAKLVIPFNVLADIAETATELLLFSPA